MNNKNYYKILGVNSAATINDIKTAYRALALKYHPDRNPNSKTAEDTFKKINEAYEVLKDPDKRSAYDQRLRSYTQQRYYYSKPSPNPYPQYDQSKKPYRFNNLNGILEF